MLGGPRDGEKFFLDTPYPAVATPEGDAKRVDYDPVRKVARYEWMGQRLYEACSTCNTEGCDDCAHFGLVFHECSDD